MNKDIEHTTLSGSLNSFVVSTASFSRTFLPGVFSFYSSSTYYLPLGVVYTSG